MYKMKKSTFKNRCESKDIFKDNDNLPLAVYPEYALGNLIFDMRYNFFITLDNLTKQLDGLKVNYNISWCYSEPLNRDYAVIVLDDDNFKR